MSSKNLTQHIVMVPLITLASAWNAVAEDSQGPPDVETQVFDIQSLLLEVPDYRATFSDLRSDDLYGPPKPHPGESLFSQKPDQKVPSPPPADPQRENMETILDIIQSVVDPESWSVNGGDVGAARFYAGQLIVTQTPENLARIKRLLDLLEAARTATVCLEAWFVHIPSGGEERLALGELASKKRFGLGEFRELLQTQEELIVVARVTVSGFDGQRVFATSGKQVNVLIGSNGVVAQQSHVAEPVVRQIMEGVTLEAQPVIDQERRAVLLDLRASIGNVLPDKPQSAELVGSLAAALAAPPYRVAHFAASLSVPMDAVSLVGVAPYDFGRDVLLFVRPTVE